MPVTQVRSIDSAAGQIAVACDAASRTVTVAGDLDLLTYVATVSALLAGREPNVVLDLSATQFVDCAGYRAISLAERGLRGAGRTLAVTGADGQPARLLQLIRDLYSTGG